MKEKVVGLISGGIDSPVANLIISEKFEMISLHFCLYPMGEYEDALKTFEVLKKVQERTGNEKTIIFPWAGILKEIKNKVRNQYSCVTCRRSMLVAASQICKTEGADGIVTGESLGQKASQTLENISATSSKIEFPIIRPLMGLNKEEIIEKAREFDIWNPDHAGCCLAVPGSPKTKASTEELDREIEKIDLLNLIEENMKLALKSKDLDVDFEDFLEDLSDKFD